MAHSSQAQYRVLGGKDVPLQTCDGVIRARYRGSHQRPTLLTPGHVYAFTIDLWATSHVFLPGHRLRVDIASSNFPRFVRNLDTGEDQAASSHFQTATQTVFHDQRYPSHILLPVIPRERQHSQARSHA